MRAPKTLQGEALEFWQRNARHCERMSTLTEVDRDSFILLCLTWGKLLEAAEGPAHDWVCLMKKFQDLSDCFGLNRKSRKRLGIEEPEEVAVDEFGL